MPSRRQHLAGLLASYRPDDEEEAEHLRRFHALLELSGDVFARDHFEPGHVTASAFVLSPSGDDLLLIHHSKLHRWLQPGGHVEPDDADVFAAARREVQEEVGMAELALAHAGIFDLDVHDIPARKGDPTHAHFDLRILLQAPHRDAVAGSDANDVRWVPLGAVNREESDESVMRAVRKLLRDRGHGASAG